MADPIEAHYTLDGADWTVAVTGRGRTLTGRAPGLIAARDKADQLAEQIAPAELGHKTVVHLLNGDAVDFTTAYLTARLARTEPTTAPTATEQAPQSDKEPADEEPADDRPTQATTSDPAPDHAAAQTDSPGETEPATEARPVAVPIKTGPATGTESAIVAALSGEQLGGGQLGDEQLDRDVPAPAASVEGERPIAAKPTPAPRTESQAAHPAAQPTEATTPAEETAPSGS